MKKYITIFLIFFLLFGVSVPAFAAYTPVPPAELDTSQYDSYIITDYSGFYYCILYHSSDWAVYVDEQEYESSSWGTYRNIKLVALKESPKVLYTKDVSKNNYNPRNDNNGWGTFSQMKTFYDDFNDETSYQWTYVGCNEVIDSNRSLYNGYIDLDTKQVVKGSVFFYNPMSLNQATGEALTQFQSQTFQTILTIVLCGIGCLALLIGLNLLRKVFPRFLNR